METCQSEITFIDRVKFAAFFHSQIDTYYSVWHYRHTPNREEIVMQKFLWGVLAATVLFFSAHMVDGLINLASILGLILEILIYVIAITIILGLLTYAVLITRYHNYIRELQDYGYNIEINFWLAIFYVVSAASSVVFGFSAWYVYKPPLYVDLSLIYSAISAVCLLAAVLTWWKHFYPIKKKFKHVQAVRAKVGLVPPKILTRPPDKS